MAEVSFDEAQQLLREHGGYEWLLAGPQFWSVSNVVAALREQGMRVSNDAVGRWFRTLPHTQDFGGPVGMRASRNDLIIFFASQMGVQREDRERRSS